jgi:hypothetical protein
VKYVVIRDDDISYFTRPKTLETLYTPLLEENKPVNFAAIPTLAANIEVDRSNIYRRLEQLEYDPIIPPEYRGRNENFPLGENKEILDYLQSLDNCEILQHGLTHGMVDGIKEFRINDREEIQRRADLGRELLQEWFKTVPSFFVPPWDNTSSEAIQLLGLRYKGLSIGRLNPTRLRNRLWISYLKKMISRRSYMFCDGLLVIEHPGYILTRFDSSESIFNKVQNIVNTQDIVVLVNHHWEYFFDWGGLNSSLLNVWRQVVDYLLQREDIRFLTFTQLYDHLIGKAI